MIKHTTLRTHLTLGTAMAAVLLVAGHGTNTALAGDCTGAGGVFTCSGPAAPGVDDEIRLDNLGGDLTVTTTPGFGIDTAGIIGADALNLQAKNSLTFIDNNTSPITGSRYGIYAKTTNDGDLTISTTGLVSGDRGGIGVLQIGAGGLTISTANVSGGANGVFAQQVGTGDLSITATGAVTGITGDGINATSFRGGVAVSAAKVSGGDDGIFVINNGTGDLTISTTGLVTGGTGEGIDARNFAGGSIGIEATDTVTSTDATGIFAKNDVGTDGVTISAAGVSGGYDGIYALNFGTGSLSITAVGKVEGVSGSGIVAANFDGGKITITTEDVAGADVGIFAQNGGYDLTLVANGVVSGGSGSGIRVSSNGDLSVTARQSVFSADSDGIFARVGGGGAALTISAADVTGGGFGIFAENEGGGDLKISTSGPVSAGGTTGEGIRADNTYGGAVDVRAYGAVRSENDDGIRATNSVDGTSISIIASEVVGDEQGLDIINKGSGDLTVNATGRVVGGRAEGILALNYTGGSISVTVSDTVSSEQSNGIFAKNDVDGGDLTVSVAGVSGAVNGILADNDGTGALSITATGTVTGAGGDGIQAVNDGTSLSISAAGVSGSEDGIDAINNGTGDLTISTTGLVTGGDGDGIEARNFTGGSISITATDTVTSTGSVGIRAENKALDGGVTISTAGVSGRGGIDARNYGDGKMEITASGAVTGSNPYGIGVNAIQRGADLTISVGDVTGGFAGIRASSDGTVSIMSDGTVAAIGQNTGVGIFANSYNGATITANNASGVTSGVSATNRDAGAISITTSGAVSSIVGAAIEAFNYGATGGIDISANDVSGGAWGINAQNSDAGSISISATGSVTAGNGDSGAGIVARNTSDQTDSIIITAVDVNALAVGIVADNDGTGEISVTTTGTVTVTQGTGIAAENSSKGTDIAISTAGVDAEFGGIWAKNSGVGNIDIAATGAVGGGKSDGIAARNYAGGSISITAMDAVTSTDTVGVYAKNGVDTDSISISTDAVSGSSDGIAATNEGSGDIEITATGAVTGTTGSGIVATGLSAQGGDMMIAAAKVTGGKYGIVGIQQGTGDLTISATGLVTGDAKNGISAKNYTGGSISITARDTVTSTDSIGIYAKNDAGTDGVTISTAGVSGRGGIDATNYGDGEMEITASGAVTGSNPFGVGIFASQYGTDLGISVADVSGGFAGIYAKNQGTGSLSITSDGAVSAGNGFMGIGIFASNYSSTDGLSISAKNVYGLTTGISASNEGAGALSITTTGAVTAVVNAGIEARNYSTTDGIDISAVDVSGGFFGIDAKNNNAGSISISATGSVRAEYDSFGYLAGQGIVAVNTSDQTDSIFITAADVTAVVDGIFADNSGTGEISITATGDIVADTGVRARNSVNGTDVTISTAGIEAGYGGVEAVNNGTGSIGITTTGVVSAGTRDGINAKNYGGGNIVIEATEAVSSTDAIGVYAKNDVGTDSISIVTDVVGGGTYGILANNAGTGALSITAEGPVTGTTNDGIDATNGPAGTDLTIAAGDVGGGTNGISADNAGSGEVSITATGTVTGETGYGILAYNSANGGGLTVSAAGVEGGADGIRARNFGTGALSIGTSGTVTGDGDRNAGIFAYNYSNGGGLTISANNVNGGTDGIYARNLGDDTLSITASIVFGEAGDGIFAYQNSQYGQGISVTVGAVEGGVTGIRATNKNAGDVTIATTGPVVGGTGQGIEAVNEAVGTISITAGDTVSSADGTGILAENGEGTSDLTIDAAGVYGGMSGIVALNDGTGSLSVTAAGAVTGANGIGIAAINGSDQSDDLTISADSVTGGNRAIVATNNGTGTLSVIATGAVTGEGDDGIFARATSDQGTGLTITAASVSGANRGVYAESSGVGDLSITASGPVSGAAGQGIAAFNRSEQGGDLTISVVDVSGGTDGIEAENAGTGILSIAASGSVMGGLLANGIDARSGVGGAGMRVTAVDVSGGFDAIRVDNQGSGDLAVTVSGTIAGGSGAGINNVDTLAQGGLITVTDTASVSSAAGVAIRDGDGDTQVVSRGALAGSVLMGGGNDKLDLIAGSATAPIEMGAGDDAIVIFGAGAGGIWDDADLSGTFDNNLGQVLDLDGGTGVDTVLLLGVTAASQALGTGTDIEGLVLSGGTLLQANNADLTGFGTLIVDDTSVLRANGNSPSDSTTGPLGNLGVIDLQDDEANDTLTVAGDFAGGAGSRLLVDLETANGGSSDALIIEGAVTDVSVASFSVANVQTVVEVNALGRGGPTRGNGVPLIDVSTTGIVEADDFVLSGPLEVGIFDYDLVLRDGTFFLQSDFFDQTYAYESLAGGLQSIGSALTGQLVERVGVRSTASGEDGTDLASSGVWARAVGLSLESDGTIDSTTGGSFDQTIGFFQGGAEAEVWRSDGGRLLVGVLGHVGTSSLDTFASDGDSAGSADIDLFGGGLTATWYSDGGWYLDSVFQYTAYDVDIAGGRRFGSTSTDGYGISLSQEAGYRIPLSETAAIVPQAQLTWQTVDFDDFTDPDGVAVNLQDGDSLVGRLGVAFEGSQTIGSALVTGYAEANLLHEFLGDNRVTASTAGNQYGLSQDLGGTAAEVGFGGTVAVAEGVSVYAEIDYTIPLDGGVRGVQASGGVRFSW